MREEGIYQKIENWFRNFHPFISALFLIGIIGTIINLLADHLHFRNQESTAWLVMYFYHTPPKALLLDLLIYTPIYEELKYRGAVALLSYFKPKLSFTSLLTIVTMLIPALVWGSGHSIPISEVFSAIIFSWLVFEIGGLKGLGQAIFLHFLINLAVVIGFFLRILIFRM